MAGNWNKWFPDGNKSKEIKPAEGVLQNAQHFLNDWLPKLGGKARGEFNAIICYNKSSDESRKKREENLVEYINSLSLEQLLGYVDFTTSKMRDAGQELNRRRSGGFHKRANQLQDFAITFNRFLHAYSGIVSIMQNADLLYGNVAFAALSLLFATMKAKAEAEASIQACILHISDRIPDYKVYERIYPDRDLGLMLSEAYRGVILFAREVTIYFQAPGAVLQDRQDETVIRGIAKALNIQNYRTKQMRRELGEDQHILNHEFGSDRRRQKMNARHFLTTTHGQYWERPGTVLLLLCGRNEISSSTTHSWLSPVATELAERHFQANDLAAYDRGNLSSTLELTLSRLILQLLERNPTIIRRAEDYREIESQISQNGDHSERIEGLRMALVRIINRCNSCVYIILNRPELCEAQPEESCTEYITTMISLVKEATAELKVMIVIKSELWDFEKNRRGIDGVDLEVFRKVRLDQGLS
ncbi:hypothetical protein EKO27_g3175 [Xylaria grammica]|uniref:DUF7708 domain-containing protein n=1 Tax=Xylaria grammica TaxID=363999 RepID=A0A439DBZ5_9PEZI|nr:hypothetical protein EKO27_g3175 [Xylaria grammica]